MEVSTESVDILPSAKKTMNSMRNIGYDLEESISDLIDNSLEAKARIIEIEFELNIDDMPTFSITDDGIGMNKEQLINAIRLGSSDRETPEFGKYGLGLKTSSIAWAKKLFVTSRVGDEANTIVLDLDTMEDKWEAYFLSKADESDIEKINLVGSPENKNGTCVRWESIDRYLDDYDGEVSKKKAAHTRRLKKINKVVGANFAQFIGVNNKPPRAKIYINKGGKIGLVKPKDLFLKDRSMKAEFLEPNIKIKKDDGTIIEEKFSIQTWILPNGKTRTPEEKEECDFNNTGEGFYIYREGRLILRAANFDLWQKRPQQSLLRFEMHISNIFDYIFQVDIRKENIRPTEKLLTVFKAFSKPMVRLAENIYYDQEDELIKKLSKGAHTGSNQAIATHIDGLSRGAEVLSRTGENNIQNKNGQKYTLDIESVKSPSSDQMFVRPVDDLPYNDFYKPNFNEEGKQCVDLNTSHEFYKRVYLPQKNINENTLNSIDYLIYTLAKAENDSTATENQKLFDDLRHEISRELSHLADKALGEVKI